MPRSSHKLSCRCKLTLTLLAGLVVGIVPGCAKPTVTEQAEPEVAAPEDSARVQTVTFTPKDSIGVFAGTSQEVTKRPEESVVAALQARTSGAIVSVSPTGAISVNIRGSGSFYGSSQPLYVVDGVPIQPGPGGALVGINPYDIVSIRVLKGPPETSIYGVRGANGVVVIKTRQPD